MTANRIINIPPIHERSRPREDIFLPVTIPAPTAAHPQRKVRHEAVNGDISLNPQLSPTAAESRELASASAAASPAVSIFEWSMSAAVSSR